MTKQFNMLSVDLVFVVCTYALIALRFLVDAGRNPTEIQKERKRRMAKKRVCGGVFFLLHIALGLLIKSPVRFRHSSQSAGLQYLSVVCHVRAVRTVCIT